MGCTDCGKDCILIDRECVNEFTPMNNTIALGDYEASVKNGQLMVKGALGDVCFPDLCEAIEASRDPDNPVALVTKWANLMEVIKPTLSWQTYAHWVKHYGFAQSGSKGRFKKGGENVETLKEEEHKMDLSRAESEAAKWLRKLKNYIRDNDEVLKCIDDCPDLTESDLHQLPSRIRVV